MANLAFTKKGEFYVSEFKVTGPFALHMEMASVGHIRVRQTSVEGSQYALVEAMPLSAQYSPVIDYQFTSEVWPMWLQIEVASQPTMAIVTMAQ